MDYDPYLSSGLLCFHSIKLTSKISGVLRVQPLRGHIYKAYTVFTQAQRCLTPYYIYGKGVGGVQSCFSPIHSFLSVSLLWFLSVIR